MKDECASSPIRARRTVTGALVGLACLTLAAPVSAQRHEEMIRAHEMMEWGISWFAMSEVLDYAPVESDRPIRYDLVGWVGGPLNRLWAKAEGEQSTIARDGQTELQLLYGRLVSPFWDAQIGIRGDVGYGEGSISSRVALALGLQGLAPGWFELEPTLFVSQSGDVSAELTASYDLLLTQRLVAQPRFELDAAVQEVPEFGVGRGFNAVDLSLRLRYEIWREVAPYVGVAWDRRLGDTADLARAAGESAGELLFVAGLRLWR